MHAAEASLSQLLNLMLAFVLLRVFGVGRTSAVGSMPAKLASFIMVTIGLFLCTLSDGRPSVAKGSSPPPPLTAFDVLGPAGLLGGAVGMQIAAENNK